MKNIFIVTALLCALQCLAQPRYDSKIHFTNASVSGSDCSVTIQIDSMNNFDYSTIKVYGDSLTVIKNLIKALEQNQKALRSQEYVETILSYITPSGQITNWKEWQLAVRNYQDFKHKQK